MAYRYGRDRPDRPNEVVVVTPDRFEPDAALVPLLDDETLAQIGYVSAHDGRHELSWTEIYHRPIRLVGTWWENI